MVKNLFHGLHTSSFSMRHSLLFVPFGGLAVYVPVGTARSIFEVRLHRCLGLIAIGLDISDVLLWSHTIETLVSVSGLDLVRKEWVRLCVRDRVEALWLVWLLGSDHPYGFTWGFRGVSALLVVIVSLLIIKQIVCFGRIVIRYCFAVMV